MDSKNFFDNFETIANAPGGITRLRELILDLAVSGKLLTRSSSDTPVTALLALIKSKHEPHGLMSEPRFLIPDHWEWVAIGTIAEHQLGKMLNKSRTNGVVRKYLRTANVASHGGFDLSLVKEMIIPEEELEKYSVRKGDLFVNEGGDVGKSAIWTSNMEDFAFQNHLHRLRPLGRITSRYLQLVLQQARNSGALLEMSAGVTIQNLSANTIRKLACPLAPPAEQERIVAKVDELMSLCDELEAAQTQRNSIRTAARKSAIDAISTATTPDELNKAWKRISNNWITIADTPESISSLRALILGLAVRGKLVSTDRHSWRSSTLGEAVEIIRGVTFPASAKERTPGKGLIPCLRTTNVQNEVDWDDLLYISEEYVRKNSQYIQLNDVLISMANSRELVGKVALVRRDDIRCTLGGFIAAIRCGNTILPRFLIALLRAPSAREKLTDSSTQTTNIANISLGRLNPFELSLPSIAEQKRIVAKVDEFMALCDELERSLLQQNALTKKLADAMAASFEA